MAKLPPLRNLRKTTIVVIAVFLGFLLHRVIVLAIGNSTVHESVDTELTLAQSVVCSHLLNGTPFGVDSSFSDVNRIYFYSTVSTAALNSNDTLMHVWFNSADTVFKTACSISQDVCQSSIVPPMLKPGEWSVDLVAGRKLLSSKQFFVESIRR